MRRVLIIGMTIAMSCVANAKATSAAWITDYDGDQAHILRTLMSSSQDRRDDETNQEDENKGKEDQQDEQYQEGDKKNDEEKDKKQDKWDPKKYLRVDCRYHNDEEIKGIEHCYASAIYKPTKWGFENVHLGIGCDAQTIYNDRGRVQTEQVGERISPPTAAFPAIELTPEGSLRSPGTYESVLDIRAGRLYGTCYVHRLEKDGGYHGDKDKWDGDENGDKKDEDGKYDDENNQDNKDKKDDYENE